MPGSSRAVKKKRTTFFIRSRNRNKQIDHCCGHAVNRNDLYIDCPDTGDKDFLLQRYAMWISNAPSMCFIFEKGMTHHL